MRTEVREVIRDRAAATLLAALTSSALGRWIFNVALPSYVYLDTRSPNWVAAVSLGRYLPALLASPLVAGLGRRRGERTALLLCDLTATGTAAGITALMLTRGPLGLMVVAAALGSTATRAKTPIAATYLAEQTREARLSAVNAALRSTESLAMTVGPAVGALVCALVSPAAGVAVTTGLLAASSLLTRSLPQTPHAPRPATRGALWEEWREVLASRGTRTFGLLGAQVSLLLGLDSVLFAVLADRWLHTDTAGYGLLFAGLGVGGLVGSALANRLGASLRPGAVTLVALTAYALPTLALFGVRSTGFAVGVQVVRGAAGCVAETVALTAAQRSTNAARMAGVVAGYYALLLAGLVGGAALAPLLLGTVGLSGALLLSGLALPAAALLAAPRMRALDRALRERARMLVDRVEVLRRTPVLAGADRATLERLAAGAVARTEPSGGTLVQAGDRADAFYVLTHGHVDVWTGGVGGSPVRWLRRLDAPNHFGEIGLLRGVPRTATVVADSGAQLLSIPREHFLRTLTGSDVTLAAMDSTVRRRLRRSEHAARGEGAPGPSSP